MINFYQVFCQNLIRYKQWYLVRFSTKAHKKIIWFNVSMQIPFWVHKLYSWNLSNKRMKWWSSLIILYLIYPSTEKWREREREISFIRKPLQSMIEKGQALLASSQTKIKWRLKYGCRIIYACSLEICKILQFFRKFWKLLKIPSFHLKK